MNLSKKILNRQKQDKGTKKSPSAVPERKAGKGSFLAGRDIKLIILTALCIVVVLVLCIGVGILQFKPRVIVTVGDTKLTTDDMMYPIYEMEKTHLPYNEMYKPYYGTSIWASGEANSFGLRHKVITNEMQYEVLYQKAVDAKYKLADDDKKDAEKQADEALKGLSWLQKLRLNISKKKLVSRFEKRILANHFREDKQEELNKDLDEDEATKDISREEYRQYDVEYYYASLKSTDSEGNQTTLSDDEKKKLQDKFKEIAKKAKQGDDFTKLASDDEKDISFNDDTNFTERGDFLYLSADNLKKVKKMKNGSVSEAFLDDETGYYVVMKMINNNSDQAYKSACDNAITTAQNEAYQTWYDAEQEKCEININSVVWTSFLYG